MGSKAEDSNLVDDSIPQHSAVAAANIDNPEVEVIRPYASHCFPVDNKAVV